MDLTAVAAGTFTAVHALYRGSRHPSPLALSSAVNGGIAGAVFFSALSIQDACLVCSCSPVVHEGIREVLVSPLLRAAQHGEEAVGGAGNTTSQPSWAQMRLHHVPDTAISGAFAGAIINAWQRTSFL